MEEIQELFNLAFETVHEDNKFNFTKKDKWRLLKTACSYKNVEVVSEKKFQSKFVDINS